MLAGTRGEAVKRPLPDDSPVGVGWATRLGLPKTISRGCEDKKANFAHVLGHVGEGTKEATRATLRGGLRSIGKRDSQALGNPVELRSSLVSFPPPLVPEFTTVLTDTTTLVGGLVQ